MGTQRDGNEKTPMRVLAEFQPHAGGVAFGIAAGSLALRHSSLAERAGGTRPVTDV